nr:MAG TPA: hypothetical protein [Caudoviricetes sp.]
MLRDIGTQSKGVGCLFFFASEEAVIRLFFFHFFRSNRELLSWDR